MAVVALLVVLSGAGVLATGGSAGGWLLSGVVAAVELVSAGGLLDVSVLSFLLQPWMSNGVMTRMFNAKIENTATFTRARFLFFCSRREPWGTNGLVLFI